MIFGIECQLVQLPGPFKRIRHQVSLNRKIVILQPLPNLVALRDRQFRQLAGWEWLSCKKPGKEFDVRVVVMDFRGFLMELVRPNKKESNRELGENRDRA